MMWRSDMTDIVERLNRIDIDDQGASLSTLDLVGEAADEIERLREKIRKLEERNSELSWTVYPDRMGR
jgi:archaellum component FlaC